MTTARRSSAILTALLVWAAQAHSATPLLRNGGFEADRGWVLGQYTTLESGSACTGKRCLRAEGPLGASAEQTVWRVQPGATVTLSAWMRTEGITGDEGGFAFAALYEHDSGGRIVRFVDFAKVTGDSPWTERAHTATLTPSTEYVVVKLGIHRARGRAWFDDVSLIPGDRAAAWAEPEADAARYRTYRAAILYDPTLPVRGMATPAMTFRTALKAEGVPLTTFTAAALIQPGALTTDRFDLLIVPTGATFPVEARRTLVAFLMDGGDLLCAGGYAFDHLVTRQDGKWVSYADHLKRSEDAARRIAILNGGLEAGSEGWHAEGPACTLDEGEASSGGRCARVAIGDAGGGGRWSARLPVTPGKAYLIGATAKADGIKGTGYGFLAVYQYGGDDKLVEFKDFAQTIGSHGWRRFEGRVVINPAAQRVMFHAGLYLAAGTLRFDDVTCGELAPEERINAHYGEPGDSLILTPNQLTLFSPDQRFAGVRAVGMWPGDKPLALPGPISGYEATAQLRQSARWQPLLEAHDRFGRLAGVAGSLVTHTRGTFAGSRWALFGATNRDVFAGGPGRTLLRRTVRRLMGRVAAASLTTDHPFYKAGETCKIGLKLLSPSAAAAVSDQALTVTIRLDAPGRAFPPVTVARRAVPAGTALPMTIEAPWRVGPGAPDFLRVTATIMAGSETLDTIETGFCVDSPALVASGPRIRYRANGFELARPGKEPTRTTLFGTDTYGNMFWSPTCSPLTWFRDLRAMRDHGLHMYENLQYPPTEWKYTETDWRRTDAIIQLSQRFGLPYMAGLLIGVDVAEDNATLAAQAAMCRAFAERYRHVPGLIYYLNGDFRLVMKDEPDLRALWNDYLRERYGTDAALKAAWGAAAVKDELGFVPVTDYAGSGVYDRRAEDTRRFQALLVRRWVAALTAAIRDVDQEHPITSEYYQRPYSGIDLRLSIDGMDAANIGYFGPPRDDIAQLLATIKWNDMRRAGKTINIGEFGVKTHDAWARDKNPYGYHTGRTEEEQRRQLWWIVHAAVAYDVTKIQNWCWADDPDGVFPWGLAYNNPLRPKPALRLWRSLRFISDLMPHQFVPADVVLVMPDTWRLGVSENAAWAGVATALECLLATNVRFDVVSEDEVGRLDPAPKLVVAPFASRMPEQALESLRALASSGATVYLSGRAAEGAGGPALPATWARTAIGRGAFIVSLHAWEATIAGDVFVRGPEATADPERNLYLQLTRTAGVLPDAEVSASSGVWRATARTARGKTLIALFPRETGPRDARVSVTHGSHEVVWEVRGAWPCMVVLDGNGGVLGATGGGILAVDGKEVARGDGPWLAASLDGKPLNRSSRVAASLTNGGTLALRSSMRRPTASVVELCSGVLTGIGAPEAKPTSDGWVIKAGPNDLVLLATQRRERWPQGSRSWMPPSGKRRSNDQTVASPEARA